MFTNSINGKVIGAGVYQVDAMSAATVEVMTNTSPTNAYRGAQAAEANYIVERLIDEAAAKLDMDPFELRHYCVKKTRFPYKTLTGAMFDSGDFHGLAAKVKQEADWKGLPRGGVNRARTASCAASAPRCLSSRQAAAA